MSVVGRRSGFNFVLLSIAQVQTKTFDPVHRLVVGVRPALVARVARVDARVRVGGGRAAAVDRRHADHLFQHVRYVSVDVGHALVT